LSFDELESGVVIRYPFLWSHEARRHETEGRKGRRPTVVALRFPQVGGDLLFLMPITTKPPRDETLAIEIPDLEKRRAGLDDDIRLWIVIEEINEDIIGKSFYLEPEKPLGRFGRPFFLQVVKTVVAQRRRIRATARG
jgi:hypothetical protein